MPPSVIDADVHLAVPKVPALFPYMPDYWIEHVENTQFKGPTLQYHPPHSPIAGRKTAEGTAPAASVDALARELLDQRSVEVAITSCLYSVDSVHNPDAAIAMARSLNDWQIAEWLERDSRLRGSIVVPIQLPAQAAEEVERVAEHPAFVQVLVPVRTEHPLGSRLFHPLFEAIERHDLVAGVHFGGAPVMPPTPTGWPSYFLEEYTAMAQIFATQLTSMIVEGLFDSFPELRVAFLESGFTWLPAHLWRMDKEWRNLRRLVPWVKRPPSQYVEQHVRFGIQPLDAPPEVDQLLQVVDQLGEELLLYTSDYPHVHNFDVDRALLAHLPEGLQTKIRSENARRFYKLGVEPS